ncbi:hypothetical protein ACIPUD_10750 [Bradyrhizobium sp. CAR08]
MSVEAQVDDRSASIIADMDWRRGWPVAERLGMGHFSDLTGWQLTIFAEPDSTIRFELYHATGATLNFSTVQLEFVGAPQFTIGLSWGVDNHLCVINGVLVAHSDQSLPPAVTLPMPGTRPPLDFSQSNAGARLKRREDAAKLSPRSGHRLRTLEEELAFLKSCRQQLAGDIDAITAGAVHRIHGCAATLRATIALGGRNFRPLLQRIAGRLDLPLPIYAPVREEPPLDPSFPQPTESYRLQVSHERRAGDAELDLDVWLEQLGFSVGGKAHNQNELVRLIADSTASHFDPDSDPALDRLESTMVFAEQVSVPMVRAYTLVLTSTIVGLADYVLSEAASAGHAFDANRANPCPE